MFQTKFKDRAPEDTITLLQNFFQDRGYEGVIDRLLPNECNLWSCVVFLSLDNKIIAQSCGKGASKEYALASGLAEMYERFCSKNWLTNNPFLIEKFMQLQFQSNGYFLSPDEKIVNYEQFLSTSALKDYYLKQYKSEENTYNFLNLFFKKNFVTIPYQLFNSKFHTDNQQIYVNPFLYMRCYSSTGLAAGNTLEEAQVQAISEIFEHIAQVQFFSNKQDVYYKIKNNSLHVNNQTIVNNIQQTGNEISIYDLSYNFKIPVCLVLLHDIHTSNFYINFGSAPNFDLAVERCLSELYQNKHTYTQPLSEVQYPFRNTTWDIPFNTAYISMSKCYCFPEELYLNVQEIDHYNTAYYSQAISNNEFLNFYKYLLTNLDLQLAYRDLSLSGQIFTVHVICVNKIVIKQGILKTLENYSAADVNQQFELYNSTYKMLQQILQQGQCDFIQFNTELDQQYPYRWELFERCNLYAPYFDKNGNTRFIPEAIVKNGISSEDEWLYFNSIYHPYFRHCLYLKQYLESNKYSKEELQKLCILLSIPIDLMNNMQDLNYLINYIFIQPFYNEWNSDRHTKFLISLQ